MNLRLTSPVWAWSSLPLAGVCLWLALSILETFEEAQRNSVAFGRHEEKVETLEATILEVRYSIGKDPEDLERVIRNMEAAATELLALGSAHNEYEALARSARSGVALIEESPEAAADALARAAEVCQAMDRVLRQRQLAELQRPFDFGAHVLFLSMASCLLAALLVSMHRQHRAHIRERLQTVKALQSSESRFRDLFDNIAEGVYRSTPDGKMLEANRALRKMLGLSLDEDLSRVDIGRDFYVDPKQRRWFGEEIERNGFVRNAEARLRRRDGQEITVLENSRVVRDLTGTPQYFEGTLTDITERKEAERRAAAHTTELENIQKQTAQQATQLLEQSFSLAEARDAALRVSQAKSEFLAGLAREIRTPLQSVISANQLLLETQLDVEQTRCARAVDRSVTELMAAATAVTDYAELETGRLELQRKRFPLRDLVDGVRGDTAQAAEAKHLELCFLVRPQVPDGFIGDAVRLQQVLFHFVSNGIQHTDSGQVAVTVSAALLSPDSALLRFEVEDSGAGVDSQAAPLLFEPFAGRKEGRQGEPVRLGLAISSRLVQMMGGQIGVESEPGQGSLFWLQVSVERDARGALAPPRRLSGMPRVLVVDDVPAARGAICELLQAWGAAPSSAEDPKQAMETLRSAARENNPFQAAILDHDLPGMSGVQLADLVLEDSSLAETSIILLTPYSQREHCGESPIQGVSHVLPKPVRESSLWKAVSSCVPDAVGSSLNVLGRHVEDDTRPCVLVAEDNQVNQTVAVRLVEKLGYAAETVDDGEQAVAAARTSRYAFILMDCQMPVMDGLTATAEIRRLPTGAAQVPIIAMTANAMAGDRERCLQAGMDDYLSKPVTLESLRAVVTRCLGKQRAEVS